MEQVIDGLHGEKELELELKYKMEFEVDYYRSIFGGLCEHIKNVYVVANSKTEALRIIRAYKKELAKECVYRTTGDVITYLYDRVA